MNAMPIVCPTCGEWLIASRLPGEDVLVLPAHADRVFPANACAAGDGFVQRGRLVPHWRVVALRNQRNPL